MELVQTSWEGPKILREMSGVESWMGKGPSGENHGRYEDNCGILEILDAMLGLWAC